QFKLTTQDEAALQEATDRLTLAEVQTQIPEMSAKLDQLEATLDAITMLEDVAEVKQQEEDITEQHTSLEQVRKTRTELKTRQHRILLLRRADATLSEIIDAYEEIAEAQQNLPVIEQQINELEHREQEELPPLEKRTRELADLAHSFGTLERMSNDLLSAAASMKELEAEAKQQEHFQNDAKALEEQIAQARSQLEQSRHMLNETTEQQRGNRPQLASRLQRLRGLSARVATLHQAEEDYARRVMNQGLADENTAQIRKTQQSLQETEHEMGLVENEAKQAQKDSDELEKQWRLLSVRYQLEEWRRLQGLAQGLTEAEQHVMLAHQRQSQFTQEIADARRNANIWLATVAGSILVAVILLVIAVVSSQWTVSIVLVLIALVVGGIAYRRFDKFHKQEQSANIQAQETTSSIGMMVAAREAAIRSTGGTRGTHDAVAQIEHEIFSLGGTVPRSIGEADAFIQQIQDTGMNLAQVQQQMSDRRDRLAAAHNQVNVTMEAVAALKKELAHLEAEREKEGWGDIVARLRTDRIAIEDKQHEIASLAGQEGLPIPNFSSLSSPSAVVPDFASTEFELEIRIEDTIKTTERELAALDDTVNVAPNVQKQIARQQETLNSLLELQRLLNERHAHFQQHDPAKDIEQARTQQMALRDALHHLQDSLRQRVSLLHVPFGQSAISAAEAAVRKQLESLNIALGNRVQLQEQRTTYATTLQERQASLAEQYHQLAKLSGTLGSWVVPPNPFAEALELLRKR
ncbi:MAG: hypothetical protein M3Z24_07745, partial [Chloroflexota bacterium]|nr:hypothetical protein [Chloroflexota bacterium]